MQLYAANVTKFFDDLGHAMEHHDADEHGAVRAAAAI
jgi:hypothetical protein